MTELGWQAGAILIVILAIVLPWAIAEIAATFGSGDDWDEVAAKKRRTERRAKQISREFQP